ncbi:hypothetical protein BK648_14080 [Pseudomonas poae]|uniref:Uncharacterized protein n=1 Tax=Pseudomonas poae TaxID=200451 RepID=A0A423F0S6_9PSED|nr:hypothetical protein [Pseudomonas poae]ROM47907.1 hypothetical protein BK648_14080 [Pseudomonas poae]
MKDLLLSLLDEYKDKYSELIFFVEHAYKTKQWGMGIMPSYNPAPYTCELQGCKPGRLLKKDCEPAKDRQCYFFDEHKKIIGEIQYAKHVKFKNQWIIYRRFFLNKPDSIIELIFGSDLEGGREANLDSVAITVFELDQATAHYSLLNTGEYFETLYQYRAKKIASVTENIWRETFTTRHYEIQHTDNDTTIFEVLPDNNKIVIFPEN